MNCVHDANDDTCPVTVQKGSSSGLRSIDLTLTESVHFRCSGIEYKTLPTPRIEVWCRHLECVLGHCCLHGQPAIDDHA